MPGSSEAAATLLLGVAEVLTGEVATTADERVAYSLTLAVASVLDTYDEIVAIGG